MTRKSYFFVILFSIVAIIKLWNWHRAQIEKQKGWTLSTSAATEGALGDVFVYKTGYSSVFVMNGGETHIEYGGAQTRMCKVKGYLPIKLDEKATYIFVDGLIIKDTVGNSEMEVLYNMRDENEQAEEAKPGQP